MSHTIFILIKPFIEPSCSAQASMFIKFVDLLVQVFLYICYPSMHQKKFQTKKPNPPKSTKNCIAANTNKIEKPIDVSGTYFQVFTIIDHDNWGKNARHQYWQHIPRASHVRHRVHLNPCQGVCVERWKSYLKLGKFRALRYKPCLGL